VTIGSTRGTTCPFAEAAVPLAAFLSFKPPAPGDSQANNKRELATAAAAAARELLGDNTEANAIAALTGILSQALMEPQPTLAAAKEAVEKLLSPQNRVYLALFSSDEEEEGEQSGCPNLPPGSSTQQLQQQQAEQQQKEQAQQQELARQQEQKRQQEEQQRQLQQQQLQQQQQQQQQAKAKPRADRRDEDTTDAKKMTLPQHVAG
jgi:hypothetical protein